MTALATPTITQMRRRLRDNDHHLVKLKGYRHLPMGQECWRWRTHLLLTRSDNTVESYEHVAAQLVADHDEYTSLRDFCHPLGQDELEAWLMERWGKDEIAASTLRQRASSLRNLFRWATDRGVTPWDPAAKIRVRQGRGRERTGYRPDTVRQLVSAQDNLRDQCALQLMALLGLRKNELRLLKIRDIDLARAEVTIQHGKGGKVSVLPLAFSVLERDLYLHVQGEARRPDEYLLYPKKDRCRPLDPSAMHRWFGRCVENAGLPAMEMHGLRHTAADELWHATGNIVLAQQLLRHENVATTITYLHPRREDLVRGLQAVEASWQGVRSGLEEAQ